MATVTTKRVDATLEAASVRWGKQHCRTFTAVANTADALDGLYLPINYLDPNLTETLGYIWFDGAGAGVDPTPAGLTLIGAVSLPGGSETAAQVAAAMKVTLDANNNFKTSTVSGDDITVENRFIGAVSAEADPDTTGISNSVITAGIGIDLGDTVDAIELALETNSVDIQSNQKSGIIADQLYTGSTATLTCNFIEVTKDRFDLLVGEVTGDSVTPGGGTKVVGFGESRLFQSLLDLGGQLIVHPIRLPSTDYSADVVFWKSAPKPSSLNFDGTAPQQLSVEFVAYLDSGIDTAINLFAKGDWTQDGLEA